MGNIITLLLLNLTTDKKDLGLIMGLIVCSFFANGLKTSAQITPDTTLPSNSITLPNANGDLITITGGTTAGNNLFHSFQEFSILSGQTAFFDNGLTIENIFSRVTGNSISNIEGIIKANGTANLFLINPNGIIFGENATLEIGGSFLGSTAESIQFSDGSFYSAVDPQAPPLLAINIPLGFQYGAEPGNIIVKGIGNNTGFSNPDENDFSLIKDFRPAGLQVREGKNLALLGGNIALDGGNLTAAEGQIELGAVADGIVKLAENKNSGIWTFDYQNINGFKDIALVNAASVEVSGNSSGTVNFQGQNISLADASAILANTSGDGIAGSITLNGVESIKVTGVSQNNIPFVTYVSTDTTAGSTGAGADLTINTPYLLVAGGAQVASAVFGSGDGGTLSVNAERVELISGSPLAGPSGLFAPIVPGATGEGANIDIEAGSLLVSGGAQASTFSVSSSKTGDFNISAQEIELDGTSPNGSPSGLFTNTIANGAGGNLTIDTDSLLVVNGAEIGSNVIGSGTAGNIDIDADNIDLTGLSQGGTSGQISASVQEGATGVGGNITIETNNLKLTDGTQINASVFGAGNGGNVDITAQEIDLTGSSPADNAPTAIFASVFRNAGGNSGNVTVETNNLRISEGAQIAVSTFSSGAAGNLKVTADNSIELTGNVIEQGGGSSGLFSSAVGGDGSGGNIDLVTNRLSIKDGATISVSNFLSNNPAAPPGTGKAGNINISAQTIAIDGIDADTPASITAATFAGGGGNIVINSETITAKNDSQITAETLGEGKGGSIEVTAKDVNIQTGAVVSSSTTGSGNAGTISMASESLNISNQGNITTSSTGVGQAGDINLESDRLEVDRGLITATSKQSGGGDINIATESVNLQNNSLISTSVSDSNGGGGDITMNNSNLILARNNSDIRANAKFGPGGNINITTELIFTDLTSDIDASSEFGLDGVVAIKSPESDKELNTAILPENIEDPSGLITASCPISNENTFAFTGNGGIPNSPYQTQSLTTTWYDLRPVNEEKTKVASVTEPLKEANATIVNADGEIELVALTPLSNDLWLKSSCSSLTDK